MKRSLAWVASWGAAAALAILPFGETGCGECPGGFNVTTSCSSTGTGVLEAPEGGPVQGPLVGNGLCTGTCEFYAAVWFASGSIYDPLALGGSISLREVRGKAPFTVDLGPDSPPEMASFSLWSNGRETTRLTIVDGRLVVTARTMTTFEATFSATLETPSGERLIIRDGAVKISGCHDDKTCNNT